MIGIGRPHHCTEDLESSTWEEGRGICTWWEYDQGKRALKVRVRVVLKVGLLHQPEQVTKAGHVSRDRHLSHVVQKALFSMATKPVTMPTGRVTMVTMGETKMADPPRGHLGYRAWGSTQYYNSKLARTAPCEGSGEVSVRVREAPPDCQKMSKIPLVYGNI